MGPSIRASSQNSAASGTAISVSAPTGTVAGDLVIVIIATNSAQSFSDNNGSTPFTEDVDSNYPTNGKTLAIYSRRIQSGDPSTYNFTATSSQRWSAVALAFSNPDPASTFDVVPTIENNDDGGSTSDLAPIITTKSNNAIHIAFCMLDRGSGFDSSPSGYTEEQTAPQQRLSVVSKKIALAGTTSGSLTWAWTTGENSLACSFAIGGGRPGTPHNMGRRLEVGDSMSTSEGAK